MKTKMTVLLIVLMNTTLVQAGIPIPDLTLYGEVTVGGEPIGAHDDVSIIARVNGDPDSLVGAYRMGDIPSAGDNYVLRIRLESLADGSSQSANAALIGQMVHVFAKISNYLEVPAGSVTVQESGAAQYLDLHNGSIIYPNGDLNADGIVNFMDFARVGKFWNRKDCGTANDWCDGADITHSTDVDLLDVSELADTWLDKASIP
ncbi:MAG: hypothetical protein GWN67_18730 [Phycisphaerae bacterium]|nr:hypothetical protein [Phycisphaerae bacterium]NIP53916.1 hypothetical protein [Phycisphaerae bacterium]NIS53078.1 hypothetical protein [Phycisphaerae bacterium]NIU10599.1 hypothetical protein [Phycisphaerae bacterium]NIU58343.1 hypothetical protein [Phycisphaerae bacterium]